MARLRGILELCLLATRQLTSRAFEPVDRGPFDGGRVKTRVLAHGQKRAALPPPPLDLSLRREDRWWCIILPKDARRARGRQSPHRWNFSIFFVLIQQGRLGVLLSTRVSPWGRPA